MSEHQPKGQFLAVVVATLVHLGGEYADTWEQHKACAYPSGLTLAVMKSPAQTLRDAADGIERCEKVRAKLDKFFDEIRESAKKYNAGGGK
jgi:hypothetical protein